MNQDKDFLSIWTPRLHGILRIVAGGLFLLHGSAKLLHVPHVPQFDHVQLLSLVGIAGVLELIGGFLLLIGLFTRPVAFILSGEMAFAYFMGHASQGFWPVLNQGTPAILFCFLFLYFSSAGPGAFSASSIARRWRVREVGFTGHHEAFHHSR